MAGSDENPVLSYAKGERRIRVGWLVAALLLGMAGAMLLWQLWFAHRREVVGMREGPQIEMVRDTWGSLGYVQHSPDIVTFKMVWKIDYVRLAATVVLSAVIVGVVGLCGVRAVRRRT